MATVVFDAVGKDTFEFSLDSVRRFGHLVSYGNASGPVPPFDIAILGNKGSLTLTRGTLATYTETRAGLEECARDLLEVVQSGAVKISITQTFSAPECRRGASGAGRPQNGRVVSPRAVRGRGDAGSLTSQIAGRIPCNRRNIPCSRRSNSLFRQSSCCAIPKSLTLQLSVGPSTNVEPDCWISAGPATESPARNVSHRNVCATYFSAAAP